MTYCGPDRRGLPQGATTRELSSLLLATTGAVLAAPFAATALVHRMSWLPLNAWVSGTSDTAFVAFLVVAALLALRWRLVGEAAEVPLAAATAVAGLFVVPTVANLATADGDIAAAVRAIATSVVAGLCWRARHLPEVHSGLRPLRYALVPIGVVAAGTSVLVLTPLKAAMGAEIAHLDAVDLAQSVLCALVAAALVAEGTRKGRLALVGAAPVLLALAGASAALSANRSPAGGAWAGLPSLFLLGGAAVPSLPAAIRARAAVAHVALQDLRGRRRWQRAEDQLSRAREVYQGQRHDIATMLSAVDGTLLVLASQRDQLPAQQVDRLLRALREEVAALRSLLSAAKPPRRYDLSGLLDDIVAVRSQANEELSCCIGAGLQAYGCPDHLAAVVGNLLANASTYAPGSPVRLTARQAPLCPAEMVEITVSDLGPGIGQRDRERAFQAGWRGAESTSRPGSGLGLSRCKELVEKEGGSIDLAATDPGAPPGRRGLTARVLIPAQKPTIL